MFTLYQHGILFFNFFQVRTNGHFAPKVTSWKAFTSVHIQAQSYLTLKRQNVANQRITQIVMVSVTMKMSVVHLTRKVGVYANGPAITWSGSTRATATKFTALRSSDAAT